MEEERAKDARSAHARRRLNGAQGTRNPEAAARAKGWDDWALITRHEWDSAYSADHSQTAVHEDRDGPVGGVAGGSTRDGNHVPRPHRCRFT